MQNMSFKIFELKNIQAPNFLMTPLELKDYIKFDVKRIYFISSPTGVTGNHAHRLEEAELFVMIQGSCRIVVDDGSGMQEINLMGPRQAISIPHMVWHGFKDFSSDAIVLAVTSTNYDSARADYIEDYEEFKRLCKQS